MASMVVPVGVALMCVLAVSRRMLNPLRASTRARLASPHLRTRTSDAALLGTARRTPNPPLGTWLRMLDVDLRRFVTLPVD